ncbi:MAG: antibiotic biosynthesis monooxygenase [Dehalococcoidia bacterium]
MAEYVTIRRWSLKEGADEASLLTLVRDGIMPAYKAQPGCLSLQLFRVGEPASYLAVTYWEGRAAYGSWAGEGGAAWRESYRPTLERWLEIMTFEQEFEAQLLVSG